MSGVETLVIFELVDREKVYLNTRHWYMSADQF